MVSKIKRSGLTEFCQLTSVMWAPGSIREFWQLVCIAFEAISCHPRVKLMYAEVAIQTSTCATGCFAGRGILNGCTLRETFICDRVDPGTLRVHLKRVVQEKGDLIEMNSAVGMYKQGMQFVNAVQNAGQSRCTFRVGLSSPKVG